MRVSALLGTRGCNAALFFFFFSNAIPCTVRRFDTHENGTEDEGTEGENQVTIWRVVGTHKRHPSLILTAVSANRGCGGRGSRH